MQGINWRYDWWFRLFGLSDVLNQLGQKMQGMYRRHHKESPRSSVIAEALLFTIATSGWFVIIIITTSVTPAFPHLFALMAL